MRQIQEEDFKEVERKIKEKKEKEATEIERKKFEEQEKLKKIQENNLQKEIKKQSLPLEPEQDSCSCILIIFRLPDGSRLQRRFDRSNKVQVTN